MKNITNNHRLLVCVVLVFCWISGLIGTNSIAIADITVNVKTDLVTLGIYGRNAAGDDTTNDNAPINAAIDYIITHGGGTVYCPAGTYRVERLYVYEDVNLVGAGKDETIFRPHPADTKTYLLTIKGGSMMDFTAYGSFPEYSGGNWVCGQNGGASYVIQAVGIIDGALIKNVRALEARKYDTLLVQEANNLYVVDCEFDRAPRACVSHTGTPLRAGEGFAFINCTFGPLRGQYLFNVETSGGKAINGGVLLNCQFNGTDCGAYGTNINLWGSFLSLKGFVPPGGPEGPNDRRNVAVVGCDFNDVWIHINGSFPDTLFTYNRILTELPVFARSVGSTSVLPNAIVQGNYFVDKKYWSQIASGNGTDFTGSSTFRCNTPLFANDSSCSWPECNEADLALLESASNVEDLAFPDLMHLCSNCPREVLEHFYGGYGDWSKEALLSELDDVKLKLLREPIAPDSAGLVGWWKMDGDTNDSSVNANHGSIVGKASYDAGKTDQAINITNKANTDVNYVVVGGDESDYDLTDAITVSAWIKMTTPMYAGYNKTRNIVAKGDSAWNLYMWSESRVKFHCSGLSVGTQYAMGGVDVSDRQWHHVAGVYDGSYLSVYIDGMLEDSLAATGSISTNNYNVSIGRSLETTKCSWTDLIDDVRIYNYALSGEEIEYLAGLRPINSLKNENMKNALIHKIDEVLEMIEQDDYEGALSKLEHDILQKTDGCAEDGKPDKNDWIRTCQEQEEIYPIIKEAIDQIITEVGPLKSHLWIFPQVIHRYGCRAEKITALVSLPEGVTKDQIDASQKLILSPGGIKAVNQCIFDLCFCRREPRHAVIIAFFDKDDLLAAVEDNGPVELQIVGRLKNGRDFHGSDTITIKPPPEKPWWHQCKR